MKISAIVVAGLFLASCAASQQEIAQKCPQIGINVAAPDFTQKHKMPEVNAFYDCMIDATRRGGLEPLLRRQHGVLGMMMQPPVVDQQSLAYQLMLWKQIATKEKSAMAAQEAWLVWDHHNMAISASQDAAAAANRAAGAANQAAQQSNMQQMRSYNCMNMGGGMVSCQ